MTQKRRKRALMLPLVSALFVLLAGCGHKTLTTGDSGSTSRLSTSATATSTSGTSNIKGDFVGSDKDKTAWIGLSSNGNRIVAFTSDGTQDKQPTFAQWFRGSIQNNTVDTTTSNGDHLTANLTDNSANGTVTLKNGKSFPFTARSVQGLSKQAGLYRSERTINGEQYVAGWVLVPEGSGAPGAGGTSTPGATGTSTPGAIGTETLTPTGTAGMETATPSMVGTPTVTVTTGAIGGAIPGGGAVVNEKTGKITQAPALTPQDLASKQVTVPNLGTFNLRQCQMDQC